MTNIDDIFNSEDILIQEQEEFSYQKYLDDWYLETKREGRLLVSFYFNATKTYFKIDSEIEIALRQETMKRKINNFLYAWGRSSRLIQFTPKYIYPTEMKKELELLFPTFPIDSVPILKLISFSIDFKHNKNRLYDFLNNLCRIIFLNFFTKGEIYITNTAVINEDIAPKKQMLFPTVSISNLNAVSNWELMTLYNLHFSNAILEYNKFTERRTKNYLGY